MARPLANPTVAIPSVARSRQSTPIAGNLLKDCEREPSLKAFATAPTPRVYGVTTPKQLNCGALRR
jgi:hypothetical protein